MMELWINNCGKACRRAFTFTVFITRPFYTGKLRNLTINYFKLAIIPNLLNDNTSIVVKEKLSVEVLESYLVILIFCPWEKI